MERKLINLIIIVLVISVLWLSVLTIEIDKDSNALAKKYKKTENVVQLNDCGNHLLPINITCTNYNSNPEWHENYNNLGTSNTSPLPFP